MAVATIAGVLYFSEGLPYGLVSELFPLYMRAAGASLTEIGLLSVVGLAWTLKFFWAPMVDRWGSYRRWVSVALAAITLVLAALSLLRPSGGSVFWILVSLLAIASATQDIAVDALTITITPKRLLGPVNSVRVTTYRVAFIFAGGGVAAIATFTSWSAAFALCALLTAMLFAYTFFLPEHRGGVSQQVAVMDGLRRWLNRSHAGWLLGVVLLYRFSDAALAPMLKPFWVDHGFTPAEIGMVTTGIGMTFTILGAWLGGAVIVKIGLWRALLWLGIFQMLSNAGYALLASFGGARPGFYAASVIENFTGGLGTAAFLAFLMAICDRRFAATEYALLSALFVLTRSVAGATSGMLADTIGYAPFFWITVLFGIPGLLLLPKIRAPLERILASDEDGPPVAISHS